MSISRRLILLIILLIFNINYCLSRSYANESRVGIRVPPSQQNTRQHPYLLITSARIAFLRQSIHTNSWYAQNWTHLKEQADRLLLERVELPPRAGNWDQYYLDTLSGTGLKFGKQLGDWQWEHYGYKTKQIFRSNPYKPKQDYDGVIIGYIHNAWALGVVQLGLAYQLSQDKRYAYKARAILLAYAELYPHLPITNRSRGRNPKDTDFGKIHVQTLDEAIWLVDLAQGADLVWSLLTVQERRQLKNQLFIPAAHLVNQPKQPTANIVCWENAAVGLVGLLTDDQQLIESALTDSVKSFHYQINHHITKDGFWTERVLGYHFYALHALIILGQAAVNAGYPVKLAPLKRMLDSPLQLVNQQLALPAFNDSHATQLREQSYAYEWGYKQFHNPAYGLVLRQQHRDKPASRGPLFLDWALLYGEQELPPSQLPITRSVNLPDVGYGLLTKGNGRNSTLLYLKYSPYTGGHSHRDQLSFVLMKDGEQVAVDPGISSYGDPAHWTWYQNSASHNTFLLNQTAQRPSTARCLGFGQGNGNEYIMIETCNAYDSVRFVRTATLLTEDLVLFVDQTQVRRPARNITIAYHQLGYWLNCPTASPYPNPVTGAGFALLKNRQIIKQQCGLSLLGQLPSGRKVRVNTDMTVPTDIIVASDPPATNGEVSSIFFQRPATTDGILAWCVTLDGQPISIDVERISETSLNTRKLSAFRLRLHSSTGRQWEVIVNPDKQPLSTEIGKESFLFHAVTSSQ